MSTPQPEPATATGAAVDALVASVHRDIGEACGHLHDAMKLFEALADESPGVNGLAAFCNGAVDQLRTMVAAAQKEAADVERKFTGRAPREPISQTVDTEHAERVARARNEQPTESAA